MDTDIRRPVATRSNGIEQFQLAALSLIHSIRADRTFLFTTHRIGFVGGIKPVSSAVQGKAAWAGAQLIKAGRRHGPRSTIDLKNVNPTTISWGQIHLGR